MYSVDIDFTSPKDDRNERKVKMLTVNLNQQRHVVLDVRNTFTTLPIAVDVQADPTMEKLLADLSPDTPWLDRKNAARKLGYMRNPEALPGLLSALPVDRFWMVRCAIIQALEMIGHPRSIPTLRKVAQNDGFEVVRSHASKAIERLSRKGIW
jgi:HEAT repeat protein